MSFKISVPRTNYIKNTSIGGDPDFVNKGSDKGRNGIMGDTSFDVVDRGDLSEVARGSECLRPLRPVTALAAPWDIPRKEGLKYEPLDSVKQAGLFHSEAAQLLRCHRVDLDFVEAGRSAVEEAREAASVGDYDISKILKHDTVVPNSFDLIKDIDDCGKINEIFNKMFCNIDNNTIRAAFGGVSHGSSSFDLSAVGVTCEGGDSLENKKKVDPFYINKFNEVVERGAASFDQLPTVGVSSGSVGTGFWDSFTPFGGGVYDVTAQSVTGAPVSQSAEQPASTTSLPLAEAEGGVLGEGGKGGDRFAAATSGGEFSDSVTQASSFVGNLEAVVNTKGLDSSLGGIKKKNTRRKKNKKNKRK
jgi:hypothetical protein